MANGRDTRMLIADKRDYRRGYEKHYQSYKRLKSGNADIHSRRLLLVYSVECGLKYRLLDKWNTENPQSILEGPDDKKIRILKSHNLERILKELGQQGNFKFPRLKTIHRDIADAESYHQLYRYCIKTQEKQSNEEEKAEDLLNDIACWIKEGMRKQ